MQVEISKALHIKIGLEKVLSCSARNNIITESQLTALYSFWNDLSFTLCLDSV